MNYYTWPCLVLFNLFATTAGFGATIVWDGGDGTGTALGTATNWVGDVSPNSANGDICQWDATVPGNLFLTAAGANGNFNNGTPGVSFYVAATHTGALNIHSIVTSSQNIALNGVNIDSGAGAFSLGDGTGNVLNIILRPSSAGLPYPIHDWVNNSTNAAIIYPNVRWQAGGGNPHVLLFDGTGDWIVTNSFTFAGGGLLYISKAASGTLFWSGPSIAGASGAGSIASPLDFEGGRVVLLASGLIGTQRITNNGVMFEYAASAAQTLSGPINGTGPLKVSNGTLTLSGLDTYTGRNEVFGGTLIINSGNLASRTSVIGGILGGTGTLSGPVTMNAGTTLAPGASIGSIGTLTINNSLTNGGNLAIEVNKSFSPSNDFVVVTGLLVNTNTGTVTVSNLGPALAVGDKFTLFSQAVSNGAALTIAGAGANWINNLAVDGSISVASFVAAPTLKFTNAGGGIQFTWAGSFKLQSQINSLGVGLNSNWSDYPGGGTSPATVPLGVTNGAVFFRLISTP